MPVIATTARNTRFEDDQNDQASARHRRARARRRRLRRRQPRRWRLGPASRRPAAITAAGERLFEAFDANQDGTLTQAEVDQARQAKLAEFDADGDGSLSLEEYQALWLDAMRERMVDRSRPTTTTATAWSRPRSSASATAASSAGSTTTAMAR